MGLLSVGLHRLRRWRLSVSVPIRPDDSTRLNYDAPERIGVLLKMLYVFIMNSSDRFQLDYNNKNCLLVFILECFES